MHIILIYYAYCFKFPLIEIQSGGSKKSDATSLRAALHNVQMAARSITR